MFRVAVLVGSTRPTSSNLKFGRALEKLAAGKLKFEYVQIDDLPFYDDSLWDSPPAEIIRLKAQISGADAVLFVTPEYNRSIPGILKNAIDWPSRPYGRSVWSGKPAAIVGATPRRHRHRGCPVAPAVHCRRARYGPDGPARNLLHSQTRPHR